MKPKNNIVFLLPILFFTLITSCNFDKVFEKTEDIQNSKWDKNHIVRFDVSIKDTINGYDIFMSKNIIAHTCFHERMALSFG